MPIRMVEDEPGQNSSNNTSGGNTQNRRSFSGAGGLGGSLGNILGALLPFLLKKPKLLIIVAAVALVYFLFFRN